MSQPLISVVIPAYNHEHFVGYAIESILGQTCQDFELVIVNDGSTDGTERVIQGYDDRRIRYYYQENQDAYNTINRGISLAKGEFIAILNSDDIFVSDRLERLLDYCRTEEKVCAFSDVIPIDEHNNEFTEPDFGWNHWHRDNREFYFTSDDLYTSFLHGNFMVTTSNLFMTREAAQEIGPFCSLRYLHDYDFIFRMIARFKDKVGYLHDKKLLYYRIHGGNTLSEAAIIGREQDQELIEKYMLEAVPEEYRSYIAAGSHRLVKLEQELNQVRGQLAADRPAGVRPALKNLKEALSIWGKKKLGGADRKPRP
jgi:glycosyltransferase involved in cell wall biosynthesis